MENKKYTQFLTDEDKLDVSFTQTRGKIISFRVNYSALINRRWRHIMRIDNCHGQPHQHTYYLHGKQYRVVLGNSTNVVFTWAKQHFIKNFQKIKENYIRT